jgi:Putative peptidoglycan binding domain
MKSRYGSRQQTSGSILVFALTIGTVTGWGMWLLADQRANKTEKELRAHVSTLAQRQVELLHEREQARNTKTDLTNLQTQAASLRQEVADLIQRRDKAQAELAAPRSEAENAEGRANEVGLGPSAGPADQRKANIILAQKELTRLGYGSLAADGIMGPSTRSALEAFQYKNSLDATRELDAATLRRLTGSTAIAASE